MREALLDFDLKSAHITGLLRRQFKALRLSISRRESYLGKTSG